MLKEVGEKDMIRRKLARSDYSGVDTRNGWKGMADEDSGCDQSGG